ncbi:MAG: hypothetical protein M0Z75_03555 [Nitrospiraceae bacterium]|nr:hypothetical protein [Nitrospiraceae bacterium]
MRHSPLDRGIHKFFLFLLPLLSVLSGLLIPADCRAHGFAGKRFFPTTFQVDDPFISDEFSVLVNNSKPAGPSANSTEINIDYSKRIAPRFGLEFHDAYQHITSASGDANGWENFDLGAKWQFLTRAEHEAIASFGTDVEIGGTGARQVSDSFSTVSPALFFGKGFPEFSHALKYLRPLAITGVIGPNFPTKRTNLTEAGVERNPVTLTWAFTVQYSFIYLQSFVKYLGLPAPLNHMVFVTEFPMQTNLSRDDKGLTTGTVNPGVVWFGKFMELGVAAEIPVNSSSGRGVGVLGLIHLFVDDLWPTGIGGPVFH